MQESTSHEEHRELYLLDLKVMWVPPYSLTFVYMKWAFGMSKKKLVSIRDHAIINLFKKMIKFVLWIRWAKVVERIIWLKSIEEINECIQRILE